MFTQSIRQRQQKFQHEKALFWRAESQEKKDGCGGYNGRLAGGVVPPTVKPQSTPDKIMEIDAIMFQKRCFFCFRDTCSSSIRVNTASPRVNRESRLNTGWQSCRQSERWTADMVVWHHGILFRSETAAGRVVDGGSY